MGEPDLGRAAHRSADAADPISKYEGDRCLAVGVAAAVMDVRQYTGQSTESVIPKPDVPKRRHNSAAMSIEHPCQMELASMFDPLRKLSVVAVLCAGLIALSSPAANADWHGGWHGDGGWHGGGWHDGGGWGWLGLLLAWRRFRGRSTAGLCAAAGLLLSASSVLSAA